MSFSRRVSELVYIGPCEEFASSRRMTDRLAIDPQWLKAELNKTGRSQSALARRLGFSSAAIVNRMCAGTREISAKEADQIRSYLEATASGKQPKHLGNTADLPDSDPMQAYVTVDVLPTYAGMGGGGSGEGDRLVALVSRSLVEDELKAKPSDLLIINVRGDSMEPDFKHGDQLIIDRRDTSPTMPGPFALLYDDGYVVKNVEVLRGKGKLRIFSSNPKYKDDEEDPETVTIMGRPAWFGRRL